MTDLPELKNFVLKESYREPQTVAIQEQAEKQQS
jgi:hypothetical protein